MTTASSTSDIEEAEPVINFKTVGSNIHSTTVTVEDERNDTTTRQLSLYTGSTKDDMKTDETRHNDLQDLTTDPTKQMTPTQDPSPTDDLDKETIQVESTTDNSLPESDQPELNPSLPGSPTPANTNPTHLTETEHPLSSQLDGGLTMQTMPLTTVENESNQEEISPGPTKPISTDTTITNIFGDDNLSTPEPDQELDMNPAQDLTPDSSSTSSTTTPCICPATTTSLGTTTTTTTGTTTASGDCLCPDIILGPAEGESLIFLWTLNGHTLVIIDHFFNFK